MRRQRLLAVARDEGHVELGRPLPGRLQRTAWSGDVEAAAHLPPACSGWCRSAGACRRSSSSWDSAWRPPRGPGATSSCAPWGRSFARRRRAPEWGPARVRTSGWGSCGQRRLDRRPPRAELGLRGRGRDQRIGRRRRRASRLAGARALVAEDDVVTGPDPFVLVVELIMVMFGVLAAGQGDRRLGLVEESELLVPPFVVGGVASQAPRLSHTCQRRSTSAW